MKLLLDTHVAIWSLTDDARLGRRAREMIAAPDNEVLVSVISVWEIAIKRGLVRSGPTAMPIAAREAIGLLEDAGYALLQITAEHAAAVEDLPRLRGDPFDRLLVAQAVTIPARLLTYDPVLEGYSELVVRV